jgi:regulator of RNase E activity RraA
LELEVPVNVGGITIHPGDLIHGDTNGVTTIPHDIASEVAHACADFAAAEQVILDYIKAGGITPAGLRDARGECVAMIKALGERVRAKAG